MIRPRTRRRGGFTLIEILIALTLSALLITGVLTLVRGQLIAYEYTDAVVKAQQNARAGLEFTETQLRRTCNGISEGSVAINIPGTAPVVRSCVRFWDGAALSSGTFVASGTTTAADAIEIIYGTGNSDGTYTVASAITGFGGTTPSVTVADMSGFAVGDLVLVTNFKRADLFKIATINGGSTPATGAGPIAFGTLSASSISPTGYTPAAGDAVMKATSSSIYFVAGTAPTPGQLYFDPDGMIGANHTDAQPLIEGVSDFQLGFGADWQAAAPSTGTQNDGIISESAAGRSANDDEWIGNATGEVLPAVPWNPTPAAAPMLLQIRATLVLRTLNTYSGAVPNLGPFENGATLTAAVSGAYPRYRVMRINVAPRAWNLGE